MTGYKITLENGDNIFLYIMVCSANILCIEIIKHYIEYLLVDLCEWCNLTVYCLFSQKYTFFVVLIVKQKK